MDFKKMLFEQIHLPDVGDRLKLLDDTEFQDIHDMYSMKRESKKKFKEGTEFIVMDFEGKFIELKPKTDDIIVTISSSEVQKYFKI